MNTPATRKPPSISSADIMAALASAAETIKEDDALDDGDDSALEEERGPKAVREWAAGRKKKPA